jgi:hypothetical protein
MSIKDIVDKAAPLGLQIRAIRDRLVTQANAETSDAALLPLLASSSSLTGCTLPTSQESVDFVLGLLGNVEVPTTEELQAAAGGMLTEQDITDVLSVIRFEALRRAFLAMMVDRLPSNNL